MASLLLTNLFGTGDSLDGFGVQIDPLRHPAIRGIGAFGARLPGRGPQSSRDCWLNVRLSHTTATEAILERLDAEPKAQSEQARVEAEMRKVNSSAKPTLAISDQPQATTSERRRAWRLLAPIAWPHKAVAAVLRPSTRPVAQIGRAHV